MNMVPRSHSMHRHALVQNLYTKEYLCGGCKTDGYGTNFGCEPCSFHMHDFCSNCPTILSSFLHHHPLSLMISNTQYSAYPTNCCDVCEDTVEGLFYWCQTCNFNVHPLCTQFPQSLCHAVHNQHRLMFQKSYKDAPCCVCGGICNSWRYRCGYCDGFDVHMECVAKSYDAKSYETTSRRLPPHAGLYSYGGANPPAANPYNNMYNPAPANDQTTLPYNRYNPYGGVPYKVNTHSLYNPYGVVPHGPYAHQPNNFYGEMPVGTNPHNMYNPSEGLQQQPYSTNPHTMYNPHNGSLLIRVHSTCTTTMAMQAAVTKLRHIMLKPACLKVKDQEN